MDSPRRVLIADASLSDLSLYECAFQREAWDVVAAHDGREALTKALVRPPSLVLTELRLPIIDGFALCDILRRDHATAHIPILVVTEEGRASEWDRARRAGADRILKKPVDPDVLLTEARRLVRDSTDLRARSSLIRGRSVGLVERAADAMGRSHRLSLKMAHARFTTTTPAVPPPDLMCPSCDQPLAYDYSYIGGVSDRHSEQWDYLHCATCGVFQYRLRTRKLVRLSAPLSRPKPKSE